MDCEVNNGSSLRDECITNLLVFGFLQSCSDNSFRRELDALGHELPVLAPQWEGYDELQTDGNRSSHSRLGRIEILKVKKTSSGILPGTSPRSGTAWTVASLRAW